MESTVAFLVGSKPAADLLEVAIDKIDYSRSLMEYFVSSAPAVDFSSVQLWGYSPGNRL
jgi:hypothetical protein